MDDIAKLADRLLLISKGDIVYDGTVDGFVAKSEQFHIVTYKFEGEPEQRSEITKSELNSFLNSVSNKGQLESFKIEETDFEHVIHSFLQKESRVF